MNTRSLGEPADRAIQAGNDRDSIDDRALIPRSKVLKLRGISIMTLWRWEHTAEFKFPKSELVNGRFYYRLGEVLNWRAPPLKVPGPKRIPPSKKSVVNENA
jgi:hypothetical protein